jgi:hypothetical protein
MRMRRTEIAAISADLQRLQRERSILLKSRIMQENRLKAVVAGTLGYHSGMAEKDRTKKFQEAGQVIKAVVAGGEASLAQVIRTTMSGIDSFNAHLDALEKNMLLCVKKLPITSWVEQPEQRGFGLLLLAIVIGETGDLFRYPHFYKVWRRLGCAPWCFEGETKMGSTWRFGKEGKLPAAEWEAFGYSPRRRSIAFLIGECLVKLNFIGKRGKAGEKGVETESALAGLYRARYLETKGAIKQTHPDFSDMRCHRHGMLLCTKLLLKKLWQAWQVQ